MTNSRARPSRFEGQRDIKLAVSFLEKAHGFSTITKEDLRATEFTSLAHSILKANLVSAHDARHDFGLDVDKVKAGRPTGIATEQRNRLITTAAMRAYDVVHGL